MTRFYLYDQGSTDQWEEEIEDYIAEELAVPIRWSFPWLTPSIRHQVGTIHLLVSFDWSFFFFFFFIVTLMGFFEVIRFLALLE